MFSGLMLSQYTAGALVCENRILSHPAATGSIPAAADQEDFVSMGMTTALKTRQIIDNAQAVLGIELMAGAQAVDVKDASGARRSDPAGDPAVRGALRDPAASALRHSCHYSAGDLRIRPATANPATAGRGNLLLAVTARDPSTGFVPSSSASYARTAFGMFLTSCSPASAKPTDSFPATCRYASSETMRLPGFAKPSRRAAILTPSP